ncbi:alpha/beta hydrolase [Streptomyces sp. NPDC050625]|uniref:alpha/beta fold hydrolase n=1 Tax=Streptomyces sp. NPDC050625 TaxID=3154629 RepID=UPI00343E7D67
MVAQVAAGYAVHPAVLFAFRAMFGKSGGKETSAIPQDALSAQFAALWANEEQRALLRRGGPVTLISGLDENSSPDIVDDRAGLKGFTVPALVIVGRHDVLCRPRWGHELHELIPNSRLLLENSGHFGHIEEPDSFGLTVADFVQRTS